MRTLGSRAMWQERELRGTRWQILPSSSFLPSDVVSDHGSKVLIAGRFAARMVFQ